MLKPLLALALLASIAAPVLAEVAPYAGEQAREIKALAPERIEGLLAGAGLGYAKAAELNGWPGPLHALELAAELALDAEQHQQIEAIREDMLANAQPLGARLIEAEADLDRLFADGEPDIGAVSEATARIARIEAELRAVHLAAHIAVKPLLNRHQQMVYARLRGYGDSGGEHGHGHQ